MDVCGCGGIFVWGGAPASLKGEIMGRRNHNRKGGLSGLVLKAGVILVLIALND